MDDGGYAHGLIEIVSKVISNALSLRDYASAETGTFYTPSVSVVRRAFGTEVIRKLSLTTS